MLGKSIVTLMYHKKWVIVTFVSFGCVIKPNVVGAVMRQSACLVINPITVDGYAALFICTPVDRASDSMMAPT